MGGQFGNQTPGYVPEACWRKSAALETPGGNTSPEIDGEEGQWPTSTGQTPGGNATNFSAKAAWEEGDDPSIALVNQLRALHAFTPGETLEGWQPTNGTTVSGELDLEYTPGQPGAELSICERFKAWFRKVKVSTASGATPGETQIDWCKVTIAILVGLMVAAGAAFGIYTCVSKSPEGNDAQAQ